MKLFFRHKDDTNPRQQVREHSITLTERNYFLLDDNDVPLKFRMSEKLERMVDEICSYLDTSASDFIRQVLFIHLYGRYDLLGLLERQFSVLDERRRMVSLPARMNPPPNQGTLPTARFGYPVS